MIRTLSIAKSLVALSFIAAPVAAVALPNFTSAVFTFDASLPIGATASATGFATIVSTDPFIVSEQITDLNTIYGPVGISAASFASGIDFTVGPNSLSFTNLVENSEFNVINGNVLVDGQIVAGFTELFTITPDISGNLGSTTLRTLIGGVDIALTAETASRLNTLFGTSLSAGDAAGTYAISTPEAASFAIFGLGLGLVGLARRCAA